MENEKRKTKTCSIALMSGKGGSGKTTLALSMASLLSSCGVKVLLIDCDISTNGATYFFEEEMSYSVDNIDTLHELIRDNKGRYNIKPYRVNEYFYFLPSVTKIGEVWLEDFLGNDEQEYLFNLFTAIASNYDVILYDCQAGYTQLLEIIVRVSDRNLMVLEADSISASAVRNLFLKLNRLWDNKRIYQIFNKATKDEAEIYNKVTSGTIFDNIGCILFDWSVRRAFSVSKIPDMVHTSPEYGMQVYELCDSLIKNQDISNKLSQYIKKKKLDELMTLENKLMEKRQKEIARYKETKETNERLERRRRRERIFNITSMSASLIAIICTIWGDIAHYNSIRINTFLLILMFSIIFVLGSTALYITYDSHKMERKLFADFSDTPEQKLHEINKSLEEVQRSIKELKEDDNLKQEV